MDATPHTSVAPPEPGATSAEAPNTRPLARAGGIDLVRAIVAPWRRGDFRELGWAAPEIEYVLVDGPAPGRWVGPAEMSAAFYEVLSPYKDYRVTAEEFH